MADHAVAQAPTARGNPPTDPRRVDQARRAARLWGEVTLAGIVVLGGFTLWHLRRRAQLLHDQAGKPRRVEWPDVDTEGKMDP